MVKEAKPSNKVWLDGAIVEAGDARISIFTETVMRGANIYEGLRGYWSERRGNFFIWHLDTHIRRLFQSMKIIAHDPLIARPSSRRLSSIGPAPTSSVKTFTSGSSPTSVRAAASAVSGQARSPPAPGSPAAAKTRRCRSRRHPRVRELAAPHQRRDRPAAR